MLENRLQHGPVRFDLAQTTTFNKSTIQIKRREKTSTKRSRRKTLRAKCTRCKFLHKNSSKLSKRDARCAPPFLGSSRRPTHHPKSRSTFYNNNDDLLLHSIAALMICSQGDGKHAPSLPKRCLPACGPGDSWLAVAQTTAPSALASYNAWGQDN